MNAGVRAVLTLAWTVAATALIGEIVIRRLNPTPATVVVRLDGPLSVDVAGEVPLWRNAPAADEALRHLDCPEDGTLDVVLAADSILYNIDTGHTADNVAYALGRLLADHIPAVCVLNLSQPGYLPYQQLEELRRLAPARRPDLVVFGVWKPDEVFTRRGDALLQIDGMARDDLGTPVIPGLAVPAPLRRWLFDHSHLWSYASLALAPRVQAVPGPGTAYIDAATWLHDSGIDAIFMAFPPLDVPFAESAAAHERARHGSPDADFHARHAALRAQVEALGLGWIDVAEALADQDVTAVRLDTCCHYNHLGHAALARVLDTAVRQRLPALAPLPAPEP